MCELLGMSANVPTDIVFSFTGLIQRGGGTGPHRDGWGIAFYEGKGIREFRDPAPGVDSEIARLISRYPIKSTAVICHIREANVGPVCLANTHPFIRELWGRHWSFAHNGQVPAVRERALRHYRPVGETDSEHAFCWLLSELRSRYPDPPTDWPAFWTWLKSALDSLRGLGVFNCLLSDGEYLYAYCTSKLHWITRRAPFGEAQLKDADLSVDFQELTTPDDVVTVIATEPLTANETWQPLASGELLVFRHGEVVGQLGATP